MSGKRFTPSNVQWVTIEEKKKEFGKLIINKSNEIMCMPHKRGFENASMC